MEPSPFPRVRNRGTPFLPVGLEISVAGPERIGGEVADWARGGIRDICKAGREGLPEQLLSRAVLD